jgi:3-deoxy-D-manno-octulosonic-acid transferase
LLRATFARLSCVAAQNEEYAKRFEALGVAPSAIHVTGTMKWDTAQIADDVPGADALAADLGIDRTRPLVVAGSTAPEEHALLHAATPRGVQLLCAPRKPEWFDAAAAALPGCVRRSATKNSAGTTTSNQKRGAAGDRFLLDTIGELRQAYALADVVVIGRSFGNLHGSDMMEPVALGKPVIVGPAVADFQDTVDGLLAGDGIIQTSAADLPQAIQSLLNDPARRAELARNGRTVIEAHQGATSRNVDLIMSHLPRGA